MGNHLAQRQAIVRTIEQRQNRFLPLDRIIPTDSGRQVVGAPETHRHAVAAFLNFGARQPGGGRQFRHPERAAPPPPHSSLMPRR